MLSTLLFFLSGLCKKQLFDALLLLWVINGIEVFGLGELALALCVTLLGTFRALGLLQRDTRRRHDELVV